MLDEESRLPDHAGSGIPVLISIESFCELSHFRLEILSGQLDPVLVVKGCDWTGTREEISFVDRT